MYYIKKIGELVVTLWGVSIMAFILLHIAPGDPAFAMLSGGGQLVDPTALEKTRHELGLDQPVYMQYLHWLSQVLRGDLGMSYLGKVPVTTMLWDRLGPSLGLVVGGLLVELIISLPLGLYAAVYHDSKRDTFIKYFSFITVSIPSFGLGLLILYIGAHKLHLFSVIATTVSLKAMIMPSITLGLILSAKFTRQVRTVVLEEIHEDYVMGARARGLSNFQIITKHVLPNVCIPLVTVVGMSIGWLLGSIAIIEIVFSYPGLGRMAIDAIAMRDYPLIIGFVMLIGTVYTLVNFGVDIIYSYLDPRVRRG